MNAIVREERVCVMRMMSACERERREKRERERERERELKSKECSVSLL